MKAVSDHTHQQANDADKKDQNQIRGEFNLSLRSTL